MRIDNLENIKTLIAQTENGQVEFKETTGQLERGMETLCAFLNGEGGTVLFGVNDKGKIIGQEVADSTKRVLADAIGRIEPLTMIQVSYVPIPGSLKVIIALSAEDMRLERPFCYKGRPYYRVESVTSTMPQTMYNQLLLYRDEAKYRWESFANDSLSLEDLDKDEIQKTVRLGIECGRLPESTGSDIPTILEKFGLMKNSKLNNAAAVLFANKELIDYPQCLLRLARFRGTDKREFIDNQRIQGNLFKQLDAAMAFMFKHLSLSGATDSLEREEHLTIPYKAIREGIINSLSHRLYRTAGGSVGIAIYDDRLEIENTGALPADWNIEKMKSEHRSEPQNPMISSVLYKRKLLENWGRGISLMIEECQKANLPEPEFKVNGNFVVVTFRYGSENPTSTRQVPDKYQTSTRQVVSLIQIIQEGTFSVKEMMNMLQLKNRGNFLNNYLNPAIQTGMVEPLYPDQPKHPQQKYRLTSKGKTK